MFLGGVWSKGKKCFRDPTGTSLRKRTSCDVLIVKIGVGFGCRAAEEPKIDESLKTLYALLHAGPGGGRGAETPNQIVMKFCTGVAAPPMSILVTVGSEVLGIAEGRVKFHTFPFNSTDLRCRP